VVDLVQPLDAAQLRVLATRQLVENSLPGQQLSSWRCELSDG